MKIAVLAEWYPSPADPVHGIWAHRQALAARDAGAQVTVLAMRRPVPPLALLRGGDLGALRRWGAAARRELAPGNLDGIRVEPVAWVAPPRPLSYGTWGWWMAPFLGRALGRLHSRWGLDLVHAHNVAPTGQAALGWTRRHGVPLVVSAHGPDIIDVPARSPFGRRAVRSALSGADLVLANSGWAAGRCVALGAAAARVRTLHLGADLPGSAPSSTVVGGAPLRLITIAHLQARKHHATVLAALARLDPTRRPSYEIVGEGEERARLEALCAQLGLADRVRFLGQLDHAEALARLAHADLFVMPGVQEPFGVAFIEAMAAGLPAVGGAGEGGPADITAAGEGMLTVTPGDPAALASLLARLDGDRAELARLGAAARRTVAEHFTWARCGAATLAAYRDVLAAAGVPR